MRVAPAFNETQGSSFNYRCDHNNPGAEQVPRVPICTGRVPAVLSNCLSTATNNNRYLLRGRSKLRWHSLLKRLIASRLPRREGAVGHVGQLVLLLVDYIVQVVRHAPC